MSGKFNSSNNNRLKNLVDSNESLDDKFASFYTESRTVSKKHSEELDADDEPIDFKQLYVTYAAPLVSKIIHIVRHVVLPRVRMLFAVIHKRVGVVGWSFGVVALLFAVFAINLFGGAGSTPTDNDATSTDVQSAVTGSSIAPAEPGFDILTSGGESVSETRFDASLQVASYADVVDGAQAVISQQQITTEQSEDELFLLQVAQSFNIQTEFSTDKGPLFVGDNREQQVQTAIFTHNELLVFVQLQRIIEPSAIIEYVNSLDF